MHVELAITRVKEWTGLEIKISPLSMEWIYTILLYNIIFHTESPGHYL